MKGDFPVYPQPMFLVEGKLVPLPNRCEFTGATYGDMAAIYFAAGMLEGCAGVLAGEFTAYAKGPCNDVIADRAYALAEAMLRRRDKPNIDPAALEALAYLRDQALYRDLMYEKGEGYHDTSSTNGWYTAIDSSLTALGCTWRDLRPIDAKELEPWTVEQAIEKLKGYK